MQNQVCKLIASLDVASELRMFEDGRKGYEMVDGVEDPYKVFGDFLEVFHQFGLKTGHFRKTYRMY